MHRGFPEFPHLQPRAAVLSHCGEGAVVGVVAGEQGGILHEHSHGFEDEGGEELDVNEIAGTAQPPVGKQSLNKLGVKSAKNDE